MVRTKFWKYVHFENFPPQLFDLAADPHEQNDLGASPDYAGIRAEMKDRMITWLASRKTRITISYDAIERITGKAKDRGYRFGEW